MEREDMSENLSYQLQQLTNEELIDFALEYLGQEHEAIRRTVLQEHFLRVKDAPSTVTAPAGDIQVLRSKKVSSANRGAEKLNLTEAPNPSFGQHSSFFYLASMRSRA